MNIHTRKLESEISESEVNEALSVLKKWRDQGGEIDLSNENTHPSEITNLWVDYPKLNDKYPTEFNLDADYKASLPDLQNGPSSLIKGSNQVIQHVGISNFKLPISTSQSVSNRQLKIRYADMLNNLVGTFN